MASSYVPAARERLETAGRVRERVTTRSTVDGTDAAMTDSTTTDSVVTDAISVPSSAVASIPSEWVSRYVRLLGVAREAPSLDALARLTRAHLLTVPFESVTSVLRRRAHPNGAVPPLDPASLLTAWEERRSGALCFDAAEMVPRLLSALGYRAFPTAGQIGWPGSHQSVLVELDEGRFLVDVGNGSPFSEPIPLDGESVVRRAGLAYRFRPGDAPDEWVQDRRIDDVWKPFCRYDLHPSSPAERDAAFQRHHVPTESWVASTLTLIRCEEDRVSVFRNGELIRFTAEGKQVEPIASPAEYGSIAAAVFGLPNLPIAEAHRALFDHAG